MYVLFSFLKVITNLAFFLALGIHVSYQQLMYVASAIDMVSSNLHVSDVYIVVA